MLTPRGVHAHQEALQRFEKARQIRPESLAVQYQIGTVYLALDRLEEALELLEEIVAEAPNFLEAHISLATVYHRLQRKEDARRHRAIVQELTAQRAAKAPGASEELGPAYRGEVGVRIPEPVDEKPAKPPKLPE